LRVSVDVPVYVGREDVQTLPWTRARTTCTGTSPYAYALRRRWAPRSRRTSRIQTRPSFTSA